MAAKCSTALVDTVPTMVLEADRKVAQRTRGTGRAHKYKCQDKAKHTKGRNNKPILESTRDQTEKLKTLILSQRIARQDITCMALLRFWVEEEEEEDVEEKEEGTR